MSNESTENTVQTPTPTVKQKQKPATVVKEYLLLTLGTFLVTLGIYFFKYPNNFATGGLSGLSVIVGHLVPFVSPAQFVAVMNVILLIVGFLFMGKSFGIRTVYCSLLMSALLWLFEKAVVLEGPLTDQPLLDLCFAVLLPAVGSAIVFNFHGSTGGTDIVAVLLQKKLRINVGNALFVVDVLVVIGVFFLFGVQTGLFSLLGLLAKTFGVNSVIDSINLSKYFIIVTEKPQEILRYVNVDLHRGATIWDGQGCFTGQPKKLLLTAVNRQQAARLRELVKTVDPHAFVLICNSSDIIGKGFRELP